jgi:hypothetical protein
VTRYRLNQGFLSCLLFGLRLSISPPPSATTLTVMLAAAARQNHHLSTGCLSNRFQLTPAKIGLKKVQITVMDADHGEARPAGPLAHIPAFAHKNFSHFLSPCKKMVDL